MSFLQPQFLWALGLLAVPLIIHLFNFRRYKKVIFGNVAMLKELKAASRKTRQLKKWLVLTSRMLALLALILAFAQPFLPQKNRREGRQLISLYLDNSESMRAEGENGQLFENGKNTARQILQSLPREIEVQVLDNALSPFSNRLYSPEKAMNIIDDLEIDYHPNDFAKVIQKVNNTFVSEGFSSQHSFVVSDFQQSESPSMVLDSNMVVHLFRMKPEPKTNLSVDSVWLEEPVSRPNIPIKLKVKVVNNGAESIESSMLMLKVNGVQQGVESFSVDAHGHHIIDITFTSAQKGWVAGEISINDVPVVFDNVYHFAVHIKPTVSVLLVGSPSVDIAKVFGSDPIFSLTQTDAGNIDYGSLGRYDFIVLHELMEVGSGLAEQLKLFARKGGVVAIIPSPKSPNYTAMNAALTMASYGALTPKNLSIGARDLKNSFLQDVYKKVPDNVLLPKVKKCYEFKSNAASQGILSLVDGTDILIRTPLGTGSVFQFSMPLGSEYSNLAKHELFVLVMLKMAFSKSNKQQLSYPLFMQESIPLDEAVQANTLILTKGKKKVLVETGIAAGNVRFWLNDELDEAGIYSLNDGSGVELTKVALNYSRQESKQRYATDEELRDQLKGVTVNSQANTTAAIKNATDKVTKGKPLWKLFIGLCLIFLMIEILLLRYLKN